MNPVNQSTKNNDVDPLTAHFVAALVHCYLGETDEAESHFDASIEYFKVRHLKIRMA